LKYLKIEEGVSESIEKYLSVVESGVKWGV
jgi:hypothetical protein